MATTVRCLYDILGLPETCSSEEIRSAYRKLALQLHPDKQLRQKNIDGDGNNHPLSEEEEEEEEEKCRTAAFQELCNAYKVLSDPKERVRYDSRRTQIQIINCDASSSSSSNHSSTYRPFQIVDYSLLDLSCYISDSAFSGFDDTNKGFFKVYGDVFDRIYANEVRFAHSIDPTGENIIIKEAPTIGNSESDYEQVSAFYDYWLGTFTTVMDFSWIGGDDQYDNGLLEEWSSVSDRCNKGISEETDQSEPDKQDCRKARRWAKSKNMRLRMAAKRDFHMMVRALAAFAKNRDKRVIKRRLIRKEEEKKRKEAELTRRKEAERVRLEEARMFKEPEWTKVVMEDEELEKYFLIVEKEHPVTSSSSESNTVKGDDSDDQEYSKLYCVVCNKKFQSNNQRKNHEQSKKHKSKFRKLSRDNNNIDKDQFEEDDHFRLLPLLLLPPPLRRILEKGVRAPIGIVASLMKMVVVMIRKTYN